MSATFDISTAATVPLFRARFLLGDTDTSSPLIQDETITSFIGEYGFNEGVAQLASGLVTRVAQEPDEYDDEGKVKMKWSSRIKAWRDLAAELRAGVAQDDGAVVASGPKVGAVTLPDTNVLRF